MCNNRCHGCKNIVLVSGIDISRDFVTLTIPDANLCNNDRVCFIIPSNAKLPENPLPVLIVIDEIKFAWLSRSGSYVYSDQLQSRRLYVGRVRTDSCVIMNERCNLSATAIDFPVIPAPKGTPSRQLKGSEVK